MAHSVPLSTPHFGNDELPSYSGLATAPGPLVRAGDFLRLACSTSVSTAVIVLNGRLLPMSGEIVPFSLTMTIATSGDQTAVTIPLTDGWIVGFTVYVESGTIPQGSTVASVGVVQSSGTGATRVMALASGNLTATRSLGLGAFTQTQGEPLTTVLVGTDPAAGAEWTQTVTAGTRWKIISIQSRLVADATVANRTPMIVFTRSAVEYFRLPPIVAITAGQSARVTHSAFGAVSSVSASGYAALMPLGLIVEGGDVLTSSTGGLQAGDNFDAPVFYYQLI